MSFRDLERGITGQQIREYENQSRQREQDELDLAKFRECEHVLNILRKIQRTESLSEEESFRKWKECVYGQQHAT